MFIVHIKIFWPTNNLNTISLKPTHTMCFFKVHKQQGNIIFNYTNTGK